MPNNEHDPPPHLGHLFSEYGLDGVDIFFLGFVRVIWILVLIMFLVLRFSWFDLCLLFRFCLPETKATVSMNSEAGGCSGGHN